MSISDNFVSYEVFHGTDEKNVVSISQHGFRSLPGVEKGYELGDGVYFFICGDSYIPPLDAARNWMVNRILSSSEGSANSATYAILKTEVTAQKNKVFDSCSDNAREQFYSFSEEVKEKARSDERTRRRLFEVSEKGKKSALWNMFSKRLGLDAVVNHLCMMEVQEPDFKLPVNVPNALVLCVKNTQIINMDSLKVVEKEGN